MFRRSPVRRSTAGPAILFCSFTLGYGGKLDNQRPPVGRAQLNKTEADIALASARYEYQIRRAELDYQVGTLH